MGRWALSWSPGRYLQGGIAMRTFLVDTTKIDVIAHISGDDLQIDRLFSDGLRGRRQPLPPLSRSSSTVTAADR
jgi:hypothetical protein